MSGFQEKHKVDYKKGNTMTGSGIVKRSYLVSTLDIQHKDFSLRMCFSPLDTRLQPAEQEDIYSEIKKKALHKELQR